METTVALSVCLVFVTISWLILCFRVSRLKMEVDFLRSLNAGLCDRITAQSELLTKQAHKRLVTE